jgi:DNA helicase-2/ATP-dependent DNA helicase PcrA
MLNSTALTPVKRFIPSTLQQELFDWVANGTGNAILIAVAGSGKTTSILRCFPFIEDYKKVLYLVFNTKNGDEMKEKMNKLREEFGKSFYNIHVATFHSWAFGVLRDYYRSANIICGRPNGFKCRDLFKKMYPDQKIQIMYSSFVCDLVSYAKGEGVGVRGLVESKPETYYSLIEHHDMRLEHEDADEAQAITYTRELMAASYKEAKYNGSIDFDDMLFMPLALNLRFPQKDWIFGDEMQDTNPVRREIIARSIKSDGRFLGVGDPCQAIYGFTGASNDAMDIIKYEFHCKELMLNVSYRCPKAIVQDVQRLVPYFNVHENNAEGDQFDVTLKDALEILTNEDMILCRNVAPIVSLAFKIIGLGRACHVLGSEIGKGLVKLVRKLEGTDINDLRDKIEAWRDREVQYFIDKGKEDKANSIIDKALCLTTMIEALPESQRTIEALINQIQKLFQDDERTLCLSSGHRSKGREAPNVVIYRPELLPSPWAKKDWMQKQERNLEYVMRTRAMNYLLTMMEVK